MWSTVCSALVMFGGEVDSVVACTRCVYPIVAPAWERPRARFFCCQLMDEVERAQYKKLKDSRSAVRSSLDNTVLKDEASLPKLREAVALLKTMPYLAQRQSMPLVVVDMIVSFARSGMAHAPAPRTVLCPVLVDVPCRVGRAFALHQNREDLKHTLQTELALEVHLAATVKRHCDRIRSEARGLRVEAAALALRAGIPRGSLLLPQGLASDDQVAA